MSLAGQGSDDAGWQQVIRRAEQHTRFADTSRSPGSPLVEGNSAIGVAHDLWATQRISADLSEALNIRGTAGVRIFLNADGRDGAVPTAGMVADDLAALR